MDSQQYDNHRRIDPLFHFVLSFVTLLIFLCSLIHLILTAASGGALLPAIVLFLMGLAFVIIFIKLRTYPLKAQDRVIRAEEQLRHYVLTGKLLDPRLNLGQIIALRFAADEEFPGLCREAAEKGLSPDSIKKAIRSWKPDHDRL